ncbi:hypothetical protein ACFVQ3_00530 [Oerskovia sp. NPDC057915]|uniref:hypothetical protein n=1 Tax=Oerskovia sp. NPDC057915 TaxID=3346280 RepID=UPI0036DEE728
MTPPLNDADRDRLNAAATDPTRPLSFVEQSAFAYRRRWLDRDDTAIVDAAMRGTTPRRPTPRADAAAAARFNR